MPLVMALRGFLPITVVSGFLSGIKSKINCKKGYYCNYGSGSGEVTKNE